MVKTFGLTHISLLVADLDRSVEFYKGLFGVSEYFRDDRSVQVKGPGPFDIIAFEKSNAKVGEHGGINHFGFRLQDPSAIDDAVTEAERCGGKVIERGEFGPGLPFAYVSDPDGYIIEIWYE